MCLKNENGSRRSFETLSTCDHRRSLTSSILRTFSRIRFNVDFQRPTKTFNIYSYAFHTSEKPRSNGLVEVSHKS